MSRWRAAAPATLLLLGALAGAHAGTDAPLVAAARSGDTAEVRRLLAVGASVDGPAEGFTPLLVALMHHHRDTAMVLVRRGADVRRPGAYGVAALHLADDAEMARALVERGADVDAWARTYGTPLHVAVQHGRSATARVLLDAGARVDAADVNGSTPLHYAAGKGYGELAASLIEAGAAVDGRNRAGFTPLHWAAGNGRPRMVDRLLDHGADPGAASADGTTPAMLARRKGHPDLATRIEAAVAAAAGA